MFFPLNALIIKIQGLLNIPDSIHIVLPEAKHRLHYSLIAVEQLLINLLSNAIRYNDKTEALIHIRFEENETFYILEVEDNGRGIPEAYLEKIFTNNFTLKTKDRFNNLGSGIGLATVKDLLYLLGSDISVNSVIDEGTTFTVRLKK
jgi:signal transduction histidine kinase